MSKKPFPAVPRSGSSHETNITTEMNTRESHLNRISFDQEPRRAFVDSYQSIAMRNPFLQLHQTQADGFSEHDINDLALSGKTHGWHNQARTPISDQPTCVRTHASQHAQTEHLPVHPRDSDTSFYSQDHQGRYSALSGDSPSSSKHQLSPKLTLSPSKIYRVTNFTYENDLPMPLRPRQNPEQTPQEASGTARHGVANGVERGIEFYDANNPHMNDRQSSPASEFKIAQNSHSGLSRPVSVSRHHLSDASNQSPLVDHMPTDQVREHHSRGQRTPEPRLYSEEAVEDRLTEHDAGSNEMSEHHADFHRNRSAHNLSYSPRGEETISEVSSGRLQPRALKSILRRSKEESVENFSIADTYASEAQYPSESIVSSSRHRRTATDLPLRAYQEAASGDVNDDSLIRSQRFPLNNGPENVGNSLRRRSCHSTYSSFFSNTNDAGLEANDGRGANNRLSVDEPIKRHRSPTKQMFGAKGWLSRTGSMNDASVNHQRKSGFKHWRGQLKQKAKGIQGDAFKVVADPFRHHKQIEELPYRPLSNPFERMEDQQPRISKTTVPISLNPPKQAKLYAELEVMLVVTVNRYLVIQKQHNRMSVESIEDIYQQWRAKNRPQVIEFMFDQLTQLELLKANMNTFRFYGPNAGDGLHIAALLKAWHSMAKEMMVRTFCAPDSEVQKHFCHCWKMLEMFGAPMATFVALQGLHVWITREIGEEKKRREVSEGIKYGITRPWYPSDSRYSP